MSSAAAPSISPSISPSPALPQGPVPGLPPGDRVTLLGLLRAIRDPLAALQEGRRRFGDPYTLHTPYGTIVQTADPANIRAIFTADPDTFEVFSPEVTSPFLGRNSLLLQNGERHRTERKLLMPPFHGARMRAYGELMREAALRHAAAWVPGRPFRFEDTAQAISLEVIARAIFGVDAPDRVARICQASRAYIDSFHPLLIFFPKLRREALGIGPWARFRRRYRALDALLREEIAARRAGNDGPDILRLLVSARYEDGGAIADEDVRDHLLTLLFAGHETTAETLSWMCYHLHRDDAARERLLAELAGLPRTDGGPELEALGAAPYLDAVCQETLRLYPVVPSVLRGLRRPFQLAGYTLPAGIAVSADVVVVHNRPDLYPEPRTWRPERFLARSYSPFEFLPFGGGARRCLGASFALYEMKIVLAALLGRYRLRPAHRRPLRLVRRNFTMGPEGGVPMVLEGEAGR